MSLDEVSYLLVTAVHVSVSIRGVLGAGMKPLLAHAARLRHLVVGVEVRVLQRPNPVWIGLCL